MFKKIILVGLLALVLFGSWSLYRRNRLKARQKSCYAGLRVILGAVEMNGADWRGLDPGPSTPTLKLGDLAPLNSRQEIPGSSPQAFIAIPSPNPVPKNNGSGSLMVQEERSPFEPLVK